MKSIIETKRLILRPWSENDAEALYKYASDPKVGLVAGWLPHRSVEESREVIRYALSEDETYAVVLKETDEPIGSIGIMPKSRANTSALENNDGEIGYWIGVPYWGQELIPEAVDEFLRYTFLDLLLDAVWCGYYDGNRQSQRVQRKCGFHYHHTETDKFCPMLDQWRTVHFSKITKEEWMNKHCKNEK